ncbi:Lrp/AsnC family transcriptional regulator [Candidatus Magnetaquicoccus inordinatus]|uniref:siroheme decarboxylase subunit beta n=1 Tax=Candidatus Magnetaquicoccus inordinatus TaxID=2496818 RepID=UPI00102CBF3B|nr:Lrp/AsnC family transcriptional regulator [Candidatus Magnetaquicoccus inordinatus]
MQEQYALINRMQSGFPLQDRPFLTIAEELAVTEEWLIATIQDLLQRGVLSRFGPLFNAEMMGGGLTLAAMAVPEERFATVTEQVNSFAEVAHNYARDHQLNMWFVVATERREQIAQVLAAIEKCSGLPVFNLPKLAEYRLGFQLQITENHVDTVAMRLPDPPASWSRFPLPPEYPDALDRAIVAATQGGLLLLPQPYQAVAAQLHSTSGEVIERMERMLAWGWIRRLGVVPNHYALGLRGNGMTVWALPEEQIDQLGLLVGGLDFVSHCYQRPRHLPSWPYNLFAMVHGPDRASVENKCARIKELLAGAVRGHALLHSTRILKKTGLRLAH